MIVALIGVAAALLAVVVLNARRQRAKRARTERILRAVQFEANHADRLHRLHEAAARQREEIRRASAPLRNAGNGFAHDVDYSPLADMIVSLHTPPPSGVASGSVDCGGGESSSGGGDCGGGSGGDD